MGYLRSIGLLVLLCLAASCGAQETIDRFRNPLEVAIAEPAVYQDDDGTYYLYGTTYDYVGLSVYTSTDMVTWSRRGLCLERTAGSWGQTDYWAPEVIKAAGKYYMYYTSRHTASGPLNICVAEAESPLGPFKDVTTPLMPVEQSYLDGNPYYDPVSKKYFLFAAREDIWPNSIVVTELSNPPTRTVGSITQVLTPTQSWEDDWVEGPYVIRHDKTYYMMYSGKAYWDNDYAIGYATASDLRGPWTKTFFNPIIARTASTVSGPGHNSVAVSPDGSELFAVYHTHLNFQGGDARQLAIDRLEFASQFFGPDRLRLKSGSPTVGLQALPSGARPRLMGTSDDFDTTTLDRARWSVFGEEPSKWRIENGQLKIDTFWGDFHQASVEAKNIFLQYVPNRDFDVETSVTFSPRQNYEQAFLVLWENQSNFIRLSSIYADGARFEIGVERDGYYSGFFVDNPWGEHLRLKMERRGDVYTLYGAGQKSDDWKQLGVPISFATVQPKVGIGAISPISGVMRTAAFDYLKLKEPSGVWEWQGY
jgi:beta-xylosidase